MSNATQCYMDLLARLGIVVTDCQRSFAVTGGFSSFQSTRVRAGRPLYQFTVNRNRHAAVDKNGRGVRPGLHRQ